MNEKHIAYVAEAGKAFYKAMCSGEVGNPHSSEALDFAEDLLKRGAFPKRAKIDPYSYALGITVGMATNAFLAREEEYE
jgi:hypothetical protein